MQRWMTKLAGHYRRTADRYHRGKMMIVFDIDGTILDARYMVRYALWSYDRQHGTDFFKDLKITDIDFHETQIESFLASHYISADHADRIMKWYEKNCWSVEAILEAHRPFAGVMEVIRWFQIQPDTYVALNSGRPESIRAETLCCINKIGRRFKVAFSNDLLYLNCGGWDGDLIKSKVDGICHFRNSGYHVFAFVDNEPANLKAVAEIDSHKDIMLLHADTLFLSQRQLIPRRAVSGAAYDITYLMSETPLPSHIQFVWHSVISGDSLKNFLRSNIQWAEFPVRLDRYSNHLVVRDNSPEEDVLENNEECPLLQNLLPLMAAAKKSIKIDMKEEYFPVDKLVDLLERCAFDESRLWFNSKIEVLKEAGFRRIAERYPHAILQCPIDHMAPLILSVPATALSLLDIFREWGINRFSISWKTPFLEAVLEKLDRWGFEVNIYNVPDLESFLKAVLLLPQSITSDFNFTPTLSNQLQHRGDTASVKKMMEECPLSSRTTHQGALI